MRLAVMTAKTSQLTCRNAAIRPVWREIETLVS
jgi:hypothetical protein